jgi:hypothetical protein
MVAHIFRPNVLIHREVPVNAKPNRSEARRTHPVLSTLPPDRARKNKVVSAEEAVQIIRDGDTVATGGLWAPAFRNMWPLPWNQYFLETGRPRDSP